MKTALFSTATLIACSLASPASAEVLFAGWDNFSSEPESESPTTHLGADTTATMTGSATGGSWNDWNGSGQGGSPDGTFGDLSNTVATADTNVGTGSSQNTNLSLGRNQKPGSLTFSLTNDSGVDRNLIGFYFDGAHRFAQSAPNWELTFGDAVSGSAVNGSLPNNSMTGAGAARDQSVDLTGLSDSLWEAGSTATFTLSFSGGPASNNTGTNGGHETLVDNIGITASVVPEPGSLALLGLGGLLIARRRRG